MRRGLCQTPIQSCWDIAPDTNAALFRSVRWSRETAHKPVRASMLRNQEMAERPAGCDNASTASHLHRQNPRPGVLFHRAAMVGARDLSGRAVLAQRGLQASPRRPQDEGEINRLYRCSASTLTA